MSKKIPNSTVYKIICPLCVMATFFLLFFFIFNCTDPVKNKISKTLTPKVSDEPGSKSQGKADPESDFKDAPVVDDELKEFIDDVIEENEKNPKEEPQEEDKKEEPQEGESFVLDSDNFNIDDLESLQYLGRILNAEQTLKLTGGFYDPQSINPGNMKDTHDQTWYYKTVIPGATGYHVVRKIQNVNAKNNILRMIYGSSANQNVQQGEDFHQFNYLDDYKKDANSPTIGANLFSFKRDKMVTVKGQLTVDLKGNTSARSDKLRIGFGGKLGATGGVILGENDIVKSGTILIEYGDQGKEYIIHNSLSSDDKAKLNALKLFTIF